MSIDWTVGYEAPISLDDARLIGRHPRRPTLWTFAAALVAVPSVVALFVVQFPPVAAELPTWAPTLTFALMPPVAVWVLVCYAFGVQWGMRPLEHWLAACLRYNRLPRTLRSDSLTKHHAGLSVVDEAVNGDGFPRGVIEVDPLNLHMADADTLAERLKSFHGFLLGLDFPIQIVVRAWTWPDTVERHWYIAVAADEAEVLGDRLSTVITALKRAGLNARALNGDLFDSLQRCWTVASGSSNLGPSEIRRTRHYSIVDGEYVRAFLLSRLPRTIDPNWLASLLDAELAVDFSMWLDPIDNTTELDSLTDRVNEWETAQQLNLRPDGPGYRDPDIEDSIKDAQRTRLFLRRRLLRVFRGSIGFVVRGPDEKVMRERERLLVAKLREQVGVNSVMPIDFEQDRAPLLAVPTGWPPLQYPLQIVSPAAAMSYPFSNNSLSMPDGVDCGISIRSRRTNRLNLFGLTNPHMIVPGTTGAGKGYWVKVFVWRLLHGRAPVRVVIIQTEKDEYSALTNAHGAQGRTVKITNLEQLGPERRLKPGVVQTTRTDKSTGFTWQSVITVDQTIDPIIDSQGRLTDSLQLVLYDLTKMSPVGDDKGLALAKLVRALERSVEHRHSPRHTVLVIDELGIVLRNKEAALAIEDAYRRFRSIPWSDDSTEVNRVAVIGITQLPSDLLGHPNGKVLAGLADTGLYLRQKPAELRVSKGPLNLTPDEVSFLESCDEGEALLVAGRARVALRLKTTSQEHELART